MPFAPQQRPGRRGRFVFFPLVFVAAALGLGWVVTALWNAILPAALHAGVLTYWQGLGLLVLCRLLFGGGWGGRRGGGGPGGFGRHPRERWQSLSAEERQQFRQRWQQWGRGRSWPPQGGSPGEEAAQP